MKRRGAGNETLRATKGMKMANDEDTAPAKAAPTTVKMKRAKPTRKGGPVTADVHPAEVENYEAAGWNKA